MRRTLSLLVAGGLVLGALVAPAGAAKSPKGTDKAPKPVQVATDPADDFGANVAAEIAPVGDALGLEVIGASIGMKDKKTVNFIFELNSLPASGGLPEVARYQWAFTVNGTAYELDGKFSNYSRGACDPTSGQCPPPRDPGMQPFLVRGNCVSGTPAVTCEEIGLVNATFDAGAATIAVPVPLSLVKAKPGSVIGGGATSSGGSINTSASAYFSVNDGPEDVLTITKTFKVPGKKKRS